MLVVGRHLTFFAHPIKLAPTTTGIRVCMFNLSKAAVVSLTCFLCVLVGNGLVSSPGHSQILSRSCFLHSCEIKSGSGLGTRLLVYSCLKSDMAVFCFIGGSGSSLGEKDLLAMGGCKVINSY